MVLDELEKTDSYDNPIVHYVLLTTANPHTSVQDVQARGPYFHRRSDDSQFGVHVVYWENLDNLDFIPRAVRERIFPEAFSIAAQPAAASPSPRQILESLPAFRRYITQVITARDLMWLETWDFSCGFVLSDNYEPFDDLYIEHDRVTHAMNGISDWLYQGTRSDLAAALPAGKRFFTALGDFRNGIRNHIIAESLPTGKECLSLRGLPADFVRAQTHKWKLTAEWLAEVYRQDVKGELRG